MYVAQAPSPLAPRPTTTSPGLAVHTRHDGDQFRLIGCGMQAP